LEAFLPDPLKVVPCLVDDTIKIGFLRRPAAIDYAGSGSLPGRYRVSCALGTIRTSRGKVASWEQTSDPESGRNNWKEYMNEVLCECARLVRQNGRAALCLTGSPRISHFSKDLESLVRANLRPFWEVEGMLSSTCETEPARTKRADSLAAETTSQVLVLKRR